MLFLPYTLTADLILQEIVVYWTGEFQDPPGQLNDPSVNSAAVVF